MNEKRHRGISRCRFFVPAARLAFPGTLLQSLPMNALRRHALPHAALQHAALPHAAGKSMLRLVWFAGIVLLSVLLATACNNRKSLVKRVVAGTKIGPNSGGLFSE